MAAVKSPSPVFHTDPGNCEASTLKPQDQVFAPMGHANCQSNESTVKSRRQFAPSLRISVKSLPSCGNSDCDLLVRVPSVYCCCLEHYFYVLARKSFLPCTALNNTWYIFIPKLALIFIVPFGIYSYICRMIIYYLLLLPRSIRPVGNSKYESETVKISRIRLRYTKPSDQYKDIYTKQG